MIDGARGLIDLKTDVPHPVRVFDYWLGGKDNFCADRRLAERILQVAPEVRANAAEVRAFYGRAVWLLAELGVRQFIQVGTGMSGDGGVHQVVHRIAPEARVVYVCEDPIVLAHARALLEGIGPTSVIHAELWNAGAIVNDPQLRTVIDFGEPVAVLLAGVLSFMDRDVNPFEVVNGFTHDLAAGSYVLLSQTTADSDPRAARTVDGIWRELSPTWRPRYRSRHEVAALLRGLELLEPGVVPVERWRPDLAPAEVSPSSAVGAPEDGLRGQRKPGVGRFWAYGVVGRKP